MKHTLFLIALLGAVVGCGGTKEESVAQAALACHSDSDEIVTQNHYVTTSNGARLHVVEKYNPARRGRPRAILMLPATLVTNLIWNAEVPGLPEYNALSRAANEGYTSYTLDYEGYGTSSRPADGKTVTLSRVVDEMGDLVRWIRHRDHVGKVDLLGASFGSSVASILGSTASPIPRGWIGHIVLTSNVYKNVSAFAAQSFFTPATQALLTSIPGGYLPTSLEQYGLVLWAAEPAVAGYCYQNCPGMYATGPTLAGFTLPPFKASTGRAKMLQFWGTADLITPLSDAEQFQSEYGGPHSLVVLNGGAHVPHWEAVREQFWDNTFAFLDDDDDGDDD